MATGRHTLAAAQGREFKVAGRGSYWDDFRTAILVSGQTPFLAKGAVQDHLFERGLEDGELLVVQFRHEQLGDRA